MEYHADAISTFITNPEEQISSLLRLELSDAALTYTLNFYIESNQKYLPKNIYKNQVSLMKIFSERNNHPYVNGLPQIDLEDLTRYNKSRIEIEDQWASHPDIAKRVKRIKGNESENTSRDHRPAGEIIKGYENICETLTSKYLTLLNIKNVGEVIEDETFTSLYLENNNYQLLISCFNGYYERHTPILENIEAIIPNSKLQHGSDLFSDKKVSLVYEKAGIEQDLQTLKYLVSQSKEIKTFRYNGTLHKAKDAGNIIPQLEKELTQVTAELHTNDKSIFQYYYHICTDEQRMDLIRQYKKMSAIDKEFDEFQENLNEFIGYLQFMAVTLPFEEIRKHRAKLLKAEKPFKQKIINLLENSAYKEFLTDEENNLLQQFVNTEYIYFNNDRYLQNEVDSVSILIEKYQGLLTTYYLNTKQELLNLQSDLDRVS